MAWIDPVTGDFATSDPTVHNSFLAIPVLTMIAALTTVISHLDLFVAFPLAGVGVICTTRHIVRGRKNNAERESMLRDGTCYQPKSAPNACPIT